MSTCPCCGERHTARRPLAAHTRRAGTEPLPPSPDSRATEVSGLSARAALWADDALIACCRRATDHAVLASRATVEVADLVIAVAANAAGRSALAARGIEATDVTHAAQAAMENRDGATAAGLCAGDTARSGRDISADMIAVLERAETVARARGAMTVEVGDVVEILLERSGDLAGAGFLATFRDRAGGDCTDTTIRRRVARMPHVAPEAPRHGPPPVQRAAAVPRDPFQIRTDIGDLAPDAEPSDEAAARTGFPEAAPDVESAPEVGSDVPAVEGTLVDAEALRTIERQVGDIATVQAETRETIERLAAGTTELRQHVTALEARDENRLDRFAAELTALRDAFLELEARISAARAEAGAKPAADDPRLDRILERIAGLEALFDKRSRGGLDVASSARDGMARSAGLGLTKGPGRWRRLRRDRRTGTGTWAASRGGTSFQPVQRGRLDVSRGLGSARSHVALEESVTAFEADGGEGDPETKRFYLAMADDVVCAPSIGPRTAARLHAHGIKTVADLLAADAGRLATELASRYVTSGTIEDWQMQARLVCTIPWLRGTHAQLLVGAGYATAGDIAEAAGDVLSADILKFAATRDGQRILRNGAPPPIERIRNWATFASMAETDRAA